MTGLGRNAQAPQFAVQVHHEGQDAFTDGTEIMVFQFLPAVGRSAEEGAAAGDQIGAKLIVLAVDQEIFLFRTHGGEDVLGGLVAKQRSRRRAWAERLPPSAAAGF
jgi:hypothetical protein